MSTPFVGLAAGILIALLLPSNESDWLGLRFVAAIVWGLLIGAALSVVNAVISLTRREGGSVWAVMIAIPAVALIAWVLIVFWSAHHR